MELNNGATLELLAVGDALDVGGGGGGGGGAGDGEDTGGGGLTMVSKGFETDWSAFKTSVFHKYNVRSYLRENQETRK